MSASRRDKRVCVARIGAAHGVRGDFTDYSGTQRLAARPRWELRVFQTGALPYFERPDEFFAAYDGFVQRATALG